MSTIRTRMGDGYVVELTPEELRADLEAGCADAVKRGKVPPLEEAEFDWLYELFAYKGHRLAGMWPHQQVKVVEEAGAHLFGPVVNTNSRRSTPWNVARAVTIVKECSRVAEIPTHANVGMGVGGVPMFEVPARRAYEVQRGDGRDRPRRRLVGGHRRSLRDVDQPRACLRHGGIRTTGDLVARMQLRKKMRLPQAKQYVADKLKVGVEDLADSTVMRTLREELDIGVITAVPGARKGIEAKRNIAELLGVEVPCLKRL